MMLRTFFVCLSLAFAGAARANLLPGDTDSFAGRYRVTFADGKPTAEGRITAPWTAKFEGRRGRAELSFGPDPVKERLSFGLVNLEDPKGLTLASDPPIGVEAGKTYELKFDLLTNGSAAGTLQLSGAARRTLPLPPTRGTWQSITETLRCDGGQLTLAFSNAATGPQNGLYISRLSLVETGAATEAVAADPAAGGDKQARLPGLYGRYQTDYAPIGRVSFLNASDADALLRSAEGGLLVEAEQQAFALSRRFAVDQASGTPQAVRLILKNRQPVLKGETPMMVFYAKGEKRPQMLDDGEDAVLQAVIRGPEDVPGSPPLKWQWSELNQIWDLGESWGRYWTAGRWAAPRDLAPGELSFEIWLAQKGQDVEIGGLALMSLSAAQRDRLPKRPWTYAGREPNAAWRSEAAERIQTHRTGKLSVRVTDAEGKPLPNAKVKIAMKRHAFHFGTEVNLDAWHGAAESGRRFSEADSRNYRTRSMAYFNRVNLDQAFHWKIWEAAKAGRAPGFTAERIAEVLRFYEERRVRVAAGPLFVAGDVFVPDEFRAADGPALTAALVASIQERAGRFQDLVADWTVVSETAGNAGVLERTGPDILARAFEATRAADAGSQAWLEEVDLRHAFTKGSFAAHGIKPGTGWVGWLRGQSAPLAGLAVHAQGGLLKRQGPERLWKLLDALPTPIRFTRLHAHIRNPKDPEQAAFQTDMIRDSLIAAYAHPRVEGVDFAGFWAGAHPFPNSALWTSDWQTTPAGDAYLDLVYKQWWTQAEGYTDAEGTFSVQGFTGSYEITVGSALVNESRQVDLGTDGLSLEFKP